MKTIRISCAMVLMAMTIGLVFAEPIQLQVEPGQTITVEITGKNPAPTTQPEPELREPPAPVLTEEVIDGVRHIRATVEPYNAALAVYLRTKSSQAPVGVIPVGQDNVLFRKFGEYDLVQGWEYWAWTEHSGMLSPESEPIHMSKDARPGPVTPPPTTPPSAKQFPADRVLRSGTTYSGNLSGGTLKLEANAKNITVVGAELDNVHVMGTDGAGFENIRFLKTEFKNFRKRPEHGDAGRANLVFTLKQTGGVIEDCTFRNNEGWGILVYGIDNSRIDYNAFINCYQGNHLLQVGDNFSHSYNYFEGLVRMASEVQGERIGSNVKFNGNVAHKWRQYFSDSFAYSWIMSRSKGMEIIGNYAKSNYTEGWNGRDENRFGYAFEVGGGMDGDRPEDRTRVESNIVVEGEQGKQFVAAFAISTHNAVIKGNEIYGRKPAWGYIFHQPGPWGKGTSLDLGNVIQVDRTKAPPVPARPTR